MVSAVTEEWKIQIEGGTSTHARTHTHTHTHTKVVHRAFWEPGSRRLTNQVCSALEDPNKPGGAEALT